MNIELHPRINVENPILTNNKIILGSFPTWTLTDSQPPNKKLIILKNIERINNGDIPFFYGSSSNQFWIWYQLFIDQNISIKNIAEIERSLMENSISITDVIISCERKEKSSLDKHLTNRTYNHSFFRYPTYGETIKILCTSKGVMNEMLLNNVFLKKHTSLSILDKESIAFQNNVIREIKGNPNNIKNPFYKILQCETGGKIECFSTPSPGSPYRKLIDFGLNTKNSKDFLNRYLSVIFKWFNLAENTKECILQ
ncbi:MAG: hypothetical protein IPO63_02480 [Bacteroidetes bacterium]|nr:hypothetical protein [Bacteroidota bacterium]